MGDRCRSGGAGTPVPFRGVAITPPPGPLTRPRFGYAKGESLSAEGERTLMGPAAQRDPRAPKAPDPLRAYLLKRTTGRKVWEWELLRQPDGI